MGVGSGLDTLRLIAAGGFADGTVVRQHRPRMAPSDFEPCASSRYFGDAVICLLEGDARYTSRTSTFMHGGFSLGQLSWADGR